MLLGLRSATHHAIAARVGAKLVQLPTSPASIDYHSRIALPANPLNNLTTSDCFWAGVFRQAQVRMAVAWGSSWVPTPAQALAGYASTGYDAVTGANDNGTDLDQGEAYCWQTGLDIGLQGPDIGLPAQLDPANAEMLDTATWLFGGIGHAWSLPIGIQGNTTFWDIPAGADDLPAWQPGSWGGHYTGGARYSRSSVGRRSSISWGIEIPASQKFIDRYLIGAVAFLSRDWIEQGVVSPTGLSWPELEAAARIASAAA